MNDDSKNYYLQEWKKFVGDKSRAENLLSFAESEKVKNVLDIGCGAGQESLPFAEKGANCFAVDVLKDGPEIGKKLFAEKGLAAKINFVQARGENLPFTDKIFQVVICRIALPYTDNRKVLSEIAAILSEDGKFFLKIHAPAFYFSLLKQRVKSGEIFSAIYPIRVLLNGFFYQIGGRQYFGRLSAGGEIYQTPKTLTKELKAVNLKIKSELSDTNRQTPSYLIVKNSR